MMTVFCCLMDLKRYILVRLTLSQLFLHLDFILLALLFCSIQARARKSLFDDPTSPAVSLNGDDNISSSTQIRDNKLDDDTYEPQSPQAQSPDKKPNSDTESSKKQHNGLSWSQTGSPITDDDVSDLYAFSSI